MMIDELKKALADYQKELTFDDEGDRIVVTVSGYIHSGYDIFAKIMGEFGATKHPFNRETRAKEYWIIPKPKKSSGHLPPEPTRKPAASTFTKTLPKGTMITVAYSRKVWSDEEGSTGFNASVEVPVERREDARFVVVDFVEGCLDKRLKELKQK